jgi:predicted metal-dependent peptidase
LHIGFFHLTDFDHLTQKDIANIAMDLEINQYISSDMMPPGPQLIENFPELNLLPKQGTKYYYDKLLQGAQNNSCPNLTKMLAAMAASKGDPQTGEGAGEIEIDVNGEPKRVRLPGHDTWEEFESLDEATKKLIKTQTGTILKEVAEQITKSRGTVPSEFLEIIERLNKLNPPRFNWRGYLRRFIGGSVKSFIKTSKHKPNFRFPDTPGIKNKPRRHILVALDTSGSVSSKELVEFLEEIHHINRTGTDVTIVECDAAIHHLGKFDPKKDFKIHGRGGTSFHPVTDYYDKNYKKFNCLIYLTDGCAPAPAKCRGPVLWAISTNGQRNEELKGFQIQLN